MEKQVVNYMEEAAFKKSSLLQHSFPQYMLRLTIAGFLIGIGVVFSFTVGNMFIDVPGTMLIAGASFSVALVFIVWMGGRVVHEQHDVSLHWCKTRTCRLARPRKNMGTQLGR